MRQTCGELLFNPATLQMNDDKPPAPGAQVRYVCGGISPVFPQSFTLDFGSTHEPHAELQQCGTKRKYG